MSLKCPAVSYRASNHLPQAVIKVADKRMREFVQMFGYVMACGAVMDLQRFAVSCYLQGCEDMAQTVIQQEQSILLAASSASPQAPQT